MSFKRDLWLNGFLASGLLPNRLRIALYRKYGLCIGKGVVCLPHVFMGSNNISIVTNTFINYNAWIEGGTTIGNNCNIAYKATFCTSSHKIGEVERRAGEKEFKNIVIGNGTWIGANALILPGVHIGSGCVIGAGAVVTKDCNNNGIYVGNPARLLKKLK